MLVLDFKGSLGFVCYIHIFLLSFTLNLHVIMTFFSPYVSVMWYPRWYSRHCWPFLCKGIFLWVILYWFCSVLYCVCLCTSTCVITWSVGRSPLVVPIYNGVSSSCSCLMQGWCPNRHMWWYYQNFQKEQSLVCRPIFVFLKAFNTFQNCCEFFSGTRAFYDTEQV